MRTSWLCLWMTSTWAARLEEIDYEPSRGLKKTQVLEFTQSSWLSNHQSVIITGATGVGKTYLACAIGNEGCGMGYPVGYFRTPTLLQKRVEVRGTYAHRPW